MTTPAGSEEGRPSIERDVLLALESALGSAKVRGFVVEYLIEAERLMAEAQAAWARRDVDAVYRPAHNLVSTAGNFGAQRVAALADALQQAARRNDHDRIEAGFAPLAVAIADAARALRAIYDLP